MPAKKVTPTSGNDSSPKLHWPPSKRIHECGLPRQDPNGQSAADDLAIRHEIRVDAGDGLHPAGMHPKTRHHFVHDEGRSGLFGNAAHFAQKIEGT